MVRTPVQVARRRPRRSVAAVIAAAVVLIAPAAALASGPGQADDVPADSTHAESVAWALENGVSVGCTDTTFCPGDPITRAQAASMLQRLSQAGMVDAATIGGLDLEGLDERFAALGGSGAAGPIGPQGLNGEPGPAGPEGPAGPPGSSAEVDALNTQVGALTAQIDDLTALVDDLADQVASLQYGSTVITASLPGSVSVAFDSPASGPASCSSSPCEHPTYSGHAVSAWFTSDAGSFGYTCADGEPERTSAPGDFQTPASGSCQWSSIPAGTIAISAFQF